MAFLPWWLPTRRAMSVICRAGQTPEFPWFVWIAYRLDIPLMPQW